MTKTKNMILIQVQSTQDSISELQKALQDAKRKNIMLEAKLYGWKEKYNSLVSKLNNLTADLNN